MVGVTSHRTTPEDIRSEQGGIRTHKSGNRGQGAHESPPVIAESSPHFRVTITEGCSCYSITTLMSEGDVGCNRDGASGQVSPVLGLYGLQRGFGRKLPCKHGGSEAPCRHTARLAASASAHCGVSTTPVYSWCRIARSCRLGRPDLPPPRHRCSDSGVRDRHGRDGQP